MFNRELCTRVLQVAGSVVLCSYAVASQADPVSLQGVCHLRSLVGTAKCDLFYTLSDDFLDPGSARKSKVLVDGNIVAIYVNDISNRSTLRFRRFPVRWKCPAARPMS
jgi:hypothetical protein